ncbi:hypothetical protein D9M71_632420 [compost metagenome]
MKIVGRVEIETVIDFRCDVCQESTRQEGGNLQFGVLQACWGYGASHDGERYELHLCERCFFATVAYLSRSVESRIYLKRTLRFRTISVWSPRMIILPKVADPSVAQVESCCGAAEIIAALCLPKMRKAGGD